MRKAHTVIIGAGVAGLAAARQLHQREPGLEVIVLEASNHVGGRLHSLDCGGEAGCGFPLFTDGPARNLCRDLNLPIESYDGRQAMPAIYLEGAGGWLANANDLSSLDLPEWLQGASPVAVWFMIAAKERQRCGANNDGNVDFRSERPRQLASMTVRELLHVHDVPEILFGMMQIHFHIFGDIDRLSALDALARSWAAMPTQNFWYLSKGTSAIPKALQGAIPCS